MKNKKKILIISSIIIGIIVLALAASYALFRLNVTKNSNFVVAVGNLELRLDENNTGNNGQIVLNSLEPLDEATALTKSGYNFTLRNTGKIDAGYDIYMDAVTPDGETKQRISDSLIWINITNTTTNTSKSYKLSELTTGLLESGILSKNAHNDYVLRIWLDLDATNSEMNKYFAAKIRVEGTQSNTHDFKKLILKNNRVRTEPIDFTLYEPYLSGYTATFGEEQSKNMSSSVQQRYFLYADSYNLYESGTFELVNPQVCKYSECYETLKGKYVVSIDGKTSDSYANSDKYSYGNIYKITDNTTLDKMYYQYSSKSPVFDNSLSGLYSTNVTNGFGGKDGTTYFFRGAMENNKVRFANLDWRIIRINEDGTVRLILDDLVRDFDAPFKEVSNDYTSAYYSNSDIKSAVEEWYSDNITGANAQKVATGNYFCEAAKLGSGTIGNVTLDNSFSSDYVPSLSCEADANGMGLINASVGFITADEMMFAGSVFSEYFENHANYLKYSYYWTMSPASYEESYGGSITGFAWYSYFCKLDTYPEDTEMYYRPVINVKSDIDVTYDSATGTYIIN